VKQQVNQALREMERRASDPVVRRLLFQLRAQGPGGISRELGKELLRVGGKYGKPVGGYGLLALLDVLMNAEPAYGPEPKRKGTPANLGASGEFEISTAGPLHGYNYWR